MRYIATLTLAVLCGFVLLAALPGGRPEDVDLAVNNPHEYAWQLFLALNTQAETGAAGVPDPSKTIRDYDDDKPVVWETWAMASGGRAGSRRSVPNRSEVFLDKGAQPPPWEKLPRTTTATKKLEPLSAKSLEFRKQKELMGLAHLDTGSLFPTDINSRFQIMSDPTLPERADVLFEGGRPTGDEVRMNQATYDFVRNNGLYSIEGLERAFRNGRRISFPKSAQEVKAQWVLISEQEKPRFHWRSLVNAKGETQFWGLSGLHIITRDVPNWTWIDFEHVDFLPFAELESDDPTTRGTAAPSRGSGDGIRKEIEGTKWAYYRLRGVQTDFADSKGVPTIVANTQIEKGFQQTSSCITCHSRATVGLRESDPTASKTRTYTLPVFEETSPVLLGSVGYPNRRWYTDERGRPRFLQTDFLWSLPFRATSENESLPNPTPQTLTFQLPSM